MKKDSSLKLAVVGCGHWGPNHIRNFKALPGVTVTWAVDKDPQRLAYVSSQYDQLTTTDNVDEMLSDKSVSAVVVATPTANHFEVCMKAIAANKHVLCEKPLATTSSDCEELINAAAQFGVVLMVGHVFLFNAGILKLKAT